MDRLHYYVLLFVSAGVACQAQEASYHETPVDQAHHLTTDTAPTIIEEEACDGAWERFHGFLFRRYAGSVEMESKTPYPTGYFGRFTYLPWKPDWVRTPSNDLRRTQYRHHWGRPTSRIFEPAKTQSPQGFPVELHSTVPMELQSDRTDLEMRPSVFSTQPPASPSLVETVVE